MDGRTNAINDNNNNNIMKDRRRAFTMRLSSSLFWREKKRRHGMTHERPHAAILDHMPKKYKKVRRLVECLVRFN